MADLAPVVVRFRMGDAGIQDERW